MSELRQQCLWEFVSTPSVAAQALAGEHKADVCVIGGGITGLSAAIHLLEQGKSVILLEAWKGLRAQRRVGQCRYLDPPRRRRGDPWPEAGQPP